MKIKYQIEHLPEGSNPDNLDNYIYIDVEFEGYPSIEDDSFDYAGTHCTGGKSGTYHLPKYVALNEAPTWDETKHTEEENKVIDAFIESKDYRQLEDQFCMEYERC